MEGDAKLRTRITKARILLDRAKREVAAVESAIKAMRAAAEPIFDAERRCQAEYDAAMRANGQCPICERPESECSGHYAWAGEGFIPVEALTAN